MSEININRKQRIDAGAMTSGLLLIAIGTLFLLDRLHVLHFGSVMRHWWPMFIVAFGVSRLMQRRLWSGLWMITIGAWLQILSLRLFDLTFRSSWPLLLIVFGAGTIVRALFDFSKRSEPAIPEERRGE